VGLAREETGLPWSVGGSGKAYGAKNGRGLKSLRSANGGGMVAALFVMRGGPYWDLPGIDPWDDSRDARLYVGPHPVIAHPPCERWGRYWHGGPSARVRRVKGDDGGCFAAALRSVRAFGGVLEHPGASAAWDEFGLAQPSRAGGSVNADFEGRQDPAG
jgi:hypothetical protein